MNYAEMTDFQINKAVAIAQGYAEEDCDFGWTGRPDVGVEWNEEAGYPSKSFNYCNSWADAGPIIEKNRISLEFDGDDVAQWCHAISCDGLHRVEYQSNPLRAAMIVFLMMQEKANE